MYSAYFVRIFIWISNHQSLQIACYLWSRYFLGWQPQRWNLLVLFLHSTCPLLSCAQLSVSMCGLFSLSTVLVWVQIWCCQAVSLEASWILNIAHKSAFEEANKCYKNIILVLKLKFCQVIWLHLSIIELTIWTYELVYLGSYSPAFLVAIHLVSALLYFMMSKGFFNHYCGEKIFKPRWDLCHSFQCIGSEPLWELVV